MEVSLFGLRMKKYRGIIIFVVAIMILSIVAGIILRGIIKGKGDSRKEDEVAVFVLESEVKEDDLIEGAYTTKYVPRQLISEDVCTYEDVEAGGKFRLALKPGTILSKSMIYKDNKVADDVRLHNYPYIKLTDKIEVGDYVDIRISFSNGADYILLSKKKVVDYSLKNEEAMTENALWLYVNEEEILRLSGAVVDASMSEGCSIYAIKYVEGYQSRPQVTYPVSALIQSLIENNPNIVDRAQEEVETDMREQVEDSFKEEESEQEEDNKQEGDNLVDVEENDSLIYEKPQEDEIIYFD